MKAKILLIDDDDKLNARLGKYLEKFEFTVVSATRPGDGIRLIERERPDIVILDVMLPDMDGFEALKEIRNRGDIPVIMLTARGDVTDRVVGLELGADDYLPKPFEPRELVARIQTILRRRLAGADSTAVIRNFGALTLNSGDYTATVDGRTVELTHLEFKALSVLIQNTGRVMNRERLLDRIRGIEWDAFDRSIDVLISRLRQKLGDDPRHPRFIKTVWGSGYMFIKEEN